MTLEIDLDQQNCEKKSSDGEEFVVDALTNSSYQ